MSTRLKDAGQEVMDRGKDVAQSALQTAKDEGAEHGRELASELKDRVKAEDERVPS